jgi:hypothetical protein
MSAPPASSARPLRAARVIFLACAGWLGLANVAPAQFPDSSAWPKTDFGKRLVEMDEIQSGGPPKDGIPPIDQPSFETIEQASAWIDPREPVIALEIAGKAKAYPIQILTWHEIVNDELGGVPVAVTFCPLCNASIVFDRRMNGQVLDFGTTGKLRKSDLVMYDRQTESWWQQFTGRAIVGAMAGAILERVPAQIVAFEDYAAAYAEGAVLSRRTGHRRDYGRNPYRGYDTIEGQPFLFFDAVDDRLPPMERVLNVTFGERHKLYPFSALAENPVINDVFASTPVAVFSKSGTLSALDRSEIAASREVPSATAYERRLDGRELTFELTEDGIRDLETGSRWNLFGRAVDGPLRGRRLPEVESGVHFAFAWLAFRPQSEIHGRGQ